MKLGLGLYRHMLTPENFAFAKQAGATHIVAHLVDWIDTAMSRRAMAGDPARKQRIVSRTPLAKFGEPADVGWAAVFLASPAAKFVTGVTLPVDGGVSVGF